MIWRIKVSEHLIVNIAQFLAFTSAQNQSRDNEELDTAKVVDVDVKHVGRTPATVFLRKKNGSAVIQVRRCLR